MALSTRLRTRQARVVDSAAEPRTAEQPAAPSERGVTRRTFVRVGAGTLATAGVVGTVTRPASRARAVTATDRLDLFINEGHVAMVDGALVYMRGYGEVAAADPKPSLTISPKVFLRDGRGPVDSRFFPLDAEVPEEGTPAAPDIDPSGPHLHVITRRRSASFFPRRTIVAESGAGIRLQITNRLRTPHTFTIDGSAPARASRSTSSPRRPAPTCSTTRPTRRSIASSASTARSSSSRPGATAGGRSRTVRPSSSASGCGCWPTSTRSGVAWRGWA
jgi:hypothetical protein